MLDGAANTTAGSLSGNDFLLNPLPVRLRRAPPCIFAAVFLAMDAFVLPVTLSANARYAGAVGDTPSMAHEAGRVGFVDALLAIQRLARRDYYLLPARERVCRTCFM